VSAPDGQDDETASQPDGVERWILPYLEESTLWPVLIVLVAHIVAFVAVALLFAIRDHRTLAIAVVAMLALFSPRVVRYEWRRRGRPASLSVGLAVIWICSFVAAYSLDHWSLF
jgi:hypothetical protein